MDAILKKVSLDIVNFYHNLAVENYSLHNPYINKQETNSISNCIKSTFISNKSIYVSKFEKQLSKFVRAKYIIALNSGTSALSIALRALGVKENDEVITSPVSFVATANAISHTGAIPHFVDIEKKNLGIDFIKLENYLKKISYKKNNILINKKTGRKISCVVPVHIFGFPLDIDQMIKFKKKFDLSILEDAAEGLGSFYKKKHLGTFGEMGILSFNGNKIITTGGGGAIITNNKKLYDFARHISSTARVGSSSEYVHDRIAWNYIMPGLNAAFGIAQIKKLKIILKKKKNLHQSLIKFFSKNQNCYIMKCNNNSKPNYWLNALILKKSSSTTRDRLIQVLNNKGLEVRPIWKLLSSLKPFKECPRSELTNALNIKNKVINLPSGFDAYNHF